MSLAMVGAKLMRSPGLTAEHARALAAESGGDLDRVCDPAIVARVAMPPAARQFLQRPDEQALSADLQWLRASGARLVLWAQHEYPPQLAATRAAPAALCVMGDVQALKEPQLAIVGARAASPSGRSLAREFAGALAQAGLTITSGLAVGIDAASHEGALAVAGRTIAVLGTGLDRLYPAENAGLARRVRAAGALVSEFPPRTGPRRRHFPRRNRVISGLSLGTLVVEAAQDSGSLITAQFAVDQGREVFAIPGPVRSPLSRGCHRLIREGACLVEEPADVLAQLQFRLDIQPLTPAPGGGRQGAGDPPEGGVRLDKDYEMLLDALGFEPATIDTLVARSGLPGESIASMLLILELEGRIAPFPGGLYGRISR